MEEILAEEVFVGGALDAGGGVNDVSVAIIADEDCGELSGLGHEEAGGGGEFVGYSEDRGLEALVGVITGAAEIEKSGDAGGADGDIGEAETPGAAESVADDYGDLFFCAAAESGGESARGFIGIFWEHGDEIFAGNIGVVDAGVGTDEAVMSFDDEDVIAADDARGLLEDKFDEAGIFF